MDRQSTHDISDVTFVKRIVLGSLYPGNLHSEEEVDAANQLLNRCLSDRPRGRILGIEKTLQILTIGEHQVVLQAMTYHVGFARRLYWLDEARGAAGDIGG